MFAYKFKGFLTNEVSTRHDMNYGQVSYSVASNLANRVEQKFHLVHEKKDQGGKKISFST